MSTKLHVATDFSFGGMPTFKPFGSIRLTHSLYAKVAKKHEICKQFNEILA